MDARGRHYRDKRAFGCAIPGWKINPFQRNPKRGMRNQSGRLGTDFLAFRVITQRGKGGVYEAIDLSVSPARLVVIKEGRSEGEIDWNGEDGYLRLKREGRVLRKLRAAGIPVPEIIAEFTQNRNRYLVLEKIAGRPLLPRNRTQPAKASWKNAEQIVRRLGALLSRIHGLGWVWRDCKPPHILMPGGELRLIDFEGACRIDDRFALPWSCWAYSSAAVHVRFRRRCGIWEDDYALGVIAFQLGTKQFPPRDRRIRANIYARYRCPNSLMATIEELLTS
jgi:serine/threonine protein kinase